ncbi:anhydro-N-acetylmuramic acid kinase [Marinobacterium sediminicola]|uniref:Anhydro-N-acetylmuramic acid kinase n=1 Tax=Marinobacterium sediminicola TaxID=518898 RepID=A0ABY1S4A1_9GAMM|nr:anhydro-N-acetylmuramic acid kinase [Marinobacterium sediminicola]ULG68881.1 anhydro-N-acetylmuramic acid kinase [Marinobacterium sediminicola]SMR77917.1 anhydro-N-acetylmuramic acid kinase [Marinobacterium sediminicola]
MKPEYYIGLMSGTSLDSVDAVLVSFVPEFQLHASLSYPLPATLRQQILTLNHCGPNEIDQLGSLDVALGRLFADAANALLTHSNFLAKQVCAIGSHGQTIRHRPERHFSLQIGDPSCIAEQTGITTVADFRRRDLAAGGQGAPLVPAFHQALFGKPGQDRVVVNLGGMANITLLPGHEDLPVLGYDTGPGNVLMDSWIRQQRGLDYDRDGNWASSGQVQPELLKRMLEHPYFQRKPPKSTGREQFDLPWLQQMLDTLDEAPSPENIQATLLELTAVSLAQAIDQHGLNHPRLFLCGGGSHNRALQNRLQHHLPDTEITSTEALGLAPDWVEAAAFAWFAMRTLNRQTSSLAAVTGAQGNRILGAIYPA